MRPKSPDQVLCPKRSQAREAGVARNDHVRRPCSRAASTTAGNSHAAARRCRSPRRYFAPRVPVPRPASARRFPRLPIRAEGGWCVGPSRPPGASSGLTLAKGRHHVIEVQPGARYIRQIHGRGQDRRAFGRIIDQARMLLGPKAGGRRTRRLFTQDNRGLAVRQHLFRVSSEHKRLTPPLPCVQSTIRSCSSFLGVFGDAFRMSPWEPYARGSTPQPPAADLLRDRRKISFGPRDILEVVSHEWSSAAVFSITWRSFTVHGIITQAFLLSEGPIRHVATRQGHEQIGKHKSLRFHALFSVNLIPPTARLVQQVYIQANDQRGLRLRPAPWSPACSRAAPLFASFR